MATASTAATSTAEKPANRPVKFLFDDEFAHDGSRVSRSKLTVTEHETALAKAEEESYRRGFLAGQAEMAAAAEHRVSIATEKVANAMNRIAGELTLLEGRLEAEAIEVAFSISRKLAPALIAREPLAEIEQLVTDVFAQIRAAPHVVVRLSKDLIDMASEHLQKLADERGYAGRLVLLPEPDLAADDCRIEWADGGIIRDHAAIEARIMEAVTRYLDRKRQNSDPENDQ
jgi:flagellar assembly protein FliH